MGQSTDALLCYGIELSEDAYLPWDNEDYEVEIEDWWVNIHGFRHSFQIYDDDTESGYVNNTKPPREVIDAYRNEKHTFFKEHPLPVELIWHCSYEYPMFILAVPGTLVRACRGNPKTINFTSSELTIHKEAVDALIEFCEKYNIEYSEPQWLLASMWG